VAAPAAPVPPTATVVSATPAAATAYSARAMPLRTGRCGSSGRAGPPRSRCLARSDLNIVSPCLLVDGSPPPYIPSVRRAGRGRKGEPSPHGVPSPYGTSVDTLPSWARHLCHQKQRPVKTVVKACRRCNTKPPMSRIRRGRGPTHHDPPSVQSSAQVKLIGCRRRRRHPPGALGHVILRNHPAKREHAPRGGHRLGGCCLCLAWRALFLARRRE
jgi:hypothetical protein